jgi:signal transduction histidine kinase
MTAASEKVDILVVDDRPEKILALQVALEPLGENIVAASSGREALRLILQRSFAVILLDINMPGLDGFETAELIRKYRVSQHTPIIFMTAAGDDMLLGKSYALGAVDYILTPPAPDVLRSKVRVFVELFRGAAQIQRQAAALARQAAQLRRLNEAALAINARLSLEGILEAVADAARDLADAHHAIATLEMPAGNLRNATSRSAKYARFGGGEHSGDDEAALAAEASQSGLIAVPLTDLKSGGRGLIQVSDKREGDFTEEDEAAVTQLAQLASLAIQNFANAEAWEANRLKDEFLATLSHELRTPLTALLGWTRLLRSGPLEPARVSRALEVIERNVNVQIALIEELLDVSRITTGKLRVSVMPMAFAPVVEAAVDALRPAAEAKGIAIRTTLADADARVLGDGERLHQVVSNLVGNAIKFTPKGGSVDIAVTRERGDVTLVVRDDGDGIPQEFMPFVFERFRQADSSITRAQGGLGLGLAVARHLVELHGGSVRAESAGRGRGATFTVRLPELTRDAVARTPEGFDEPTLVEGVEGAPTSGRISEPGPKSGVQTLDGVRVLVVDDDDDARELIKEVLSRHRAHVFTASSASEALRAMDTHAPHVLVSDVAMRGGDGYELIRHVRTRRREEGGAVPALALTAYARREDRARALNAGFHMHAQKPIEPLELIAAVATLAGGGTPEEP